MSVAQFLNARFVRSRQRSTVILSHLVPCMAQWYRGVRGRLPRSGQGNNAISAPLHGWAIMYILGSLFHRPDSFLTYFCLVLVSADRCATKPTWSVSVCRSCNPSSRYTGTNSRIARVRRWDCWKGGYKMVGCARHQDEFFSTTVRSLASNTLVDNNTPTHSYFDSQFD